VWNRLPREVVTDELGTLTRTGNFWRRRPELAPVPVVLYAGRSVPDSRMLTVAASAIARLPHLEASARNYVEQLRLPQTRLGKLLAVGIDRPDREWIISELTPRNQAAADAILSGEPTVTLELEIVGETDVLDVTFVGDVPVDCDAH
jgi:hypothetical protein